MSPVYQEQRWGMQSGWAVYALPNRTPSADSESMAGVWRCGLPVQLIMVALC